MHEIGYIVLSWHFVTGVLRFEVEEAAMFQHARIKLANTCAFTARQKAKAEGEIG